MDFWECPECGSEFWPGTEDTKKIWKKEILEKQGLKLSAPKRKVPQRRGTGKEYLTLRFEVFKRDKFKCVYCGRSPKDGAILEVDHVIPVIDGGRVAMDNLVTCCRECNQGKGSIPLDKHKGA
jgi:CRISPR/Cas system Type II protein with McrA/HNH and RuvC-like nuclease domain